jgi:hypothetical protein
MAITSKNKKGSWYNAKSLINKLIKSFKKSSAKLARTDA